MANVKNLMLECWVRNDLTLLLGKYFIVETDFQVSLYLIPTGHRRPPGSSLFIRCERRPTATSTLGSLCNDSADLTFSTRHPQTSQKIKF